MIGRTLVRERAEILAPIVALLLAFAPTEGVVVSAADPPADRADGDTALHVELTPIATRVGERFDLTLRIRTLEPLAVIAFRIDTVRAHLRMTSWSFGDGLLRHIAEHGEPPACDIIIYPDGSRMFAVLALAETFSSDVYGPEWLDVHFQVRAEEPVATCIMVQCDTPDYEPGDDLLSIVSGMRTARRCLPVLVRHAESFRRGDADGDGRQSISDAIGILAYLFGGKRPGGCPDAADVNDDGRISLTDPVLLLQTLVGGHPAVGHHCLPDLTEDELPACAEPAC